MEIFDSVHNIDRKMVTGSKTPRKSIVSHKNVKVGQKMPMRGGKIKKKQVSRPRRFSLIYSSDSALSDVSDAENGPARTEKAYTKRKTGRVKNASNNAAGKTGRLIQGGTSDPTDSSDQAIVSDEDSDDESDDSDESDDEGSDSDGSDSNTSSDDENIDFVKLTAQRKKRAMKALSALKRNKSPTKSPVKKVEKSPVDYRKDRKDKEEEQESSGGDSERADNEVALAFNFRKDDDGIRYGSVSEHSEEDIGEEVKESNEINMNLPFNDNLNQLHVPQLSASDESEYDIDQDAYFNVIEDESMGEIETGLETGEDDVPILHEEEKNLVSELQNADDLSFDGSIHEDGSDPAERLRSSYIDAADDDENDEDDDEIMTVFDMPFYEDPKFASLYYCEDGSEPRLSLSTSLPLLVSDEKLKRLKLREAKKLERQERKQRRKLLKVKKKGKDTKTSQVDGEEYIFGIFFQSDDEHKDGDVQGSRVALQGSTDLESPLRRLGSAAASDISSDDEYDNILLDIAHMPSDDEANSSKDGHSVASSVPNTSAINTDGDSDVMDTDGDDDDDDLSDTNVFIDIDDLDPDSFYFQDHDDSTSLSEITDDPDDDKEKSKSEVLETVEYVDDESTDEDDNLPPPSSRSKVIGSKAKEVVSANVVGLKPPKLGTWETDSKPFTIIDGLSTKSLYPLIQEHQQLIEQQQRSQSQSPDLRLGQEGGNTNGDELTLNELLNMSELEDEETATPSFSQVISNWYEKPKVPLSAFRNKGVNEHEDDEYMLPVNATRKVPIGYVGSERTRRKIDKMKELQRKKTEKKRKIKKRKKLLKLKRRQERLEKSSQTEKTPEAASELAVRTPGIDQHDDRFSEELQDLPSRSRKSSLKSVGLEEIHEILGKDNSDLYDGGEPLYELPEGSDHAIDLADADILSSLTAPIQLSDIGGAPSWRRRQSMVEAAAENLRFTKSGLFSESALADIEDIIGTGVTAGAFEFSESLQ